MFQSEYIYPAEYTIPAIDFKQHPKRHGNECDNQITHGQIYKKMIRHLFTDSFKNPKYYDDRHVTGYWQQHHKT